MPGKLKPVDDTPICDPAYIKRIDPVWLHGKVPNRFWEDRKHRRDYLLWLGQRLGFRRMPDWYRLTLAGLAKSKHGQRVIMYWGLSALTAVQDCFPLYDWKPWLFEVVAIGFWDSRANRRRYMEWLGERLGYRSLDDWYAVTTHDFKRNRGKGLLTYYQESPVRAVVDLQPGLNRREWQFTQVPKGFWDAAENWHRYLRWLGMELGFRRPEDWYHIKSSDLASRHGSSLLQRYSSLCDLMREFLPQLDWDRVDTHRKIRTEEILAWADAHYAGHGGWPTSLSGDIPEAGRTWLAMDQALRHGLHGLPIRISLARLLESERGVRWGRRPPDLSEKQILDWADAFFAAEGKWPGEDSGRIPGTKEIWKHVSGALRLGSRGLPGGSSLAKLLARARGVRNKQDLPPLTQEQILAWADAYFAAHGKWPTRNSGTIDGTDETWVGVAYAMFAGYRGLRRRYTLARLLVQRRGARSVQYLPRLTEKQILAWADAHFAAHGKWPTSKSGPIAGASETWGAVAVAMHAGCRGLRRRFSLPQLLAKRRGVRNRKALPHLEEKLILAWADAHFKATGKWPTSNGGPISQSPGDTWTAVEVALAHGQRGLPGSSSLAKLLAQRRGVRNRASPPPLSEQRILAWAKAQYKATGRWPSEDSGPIKQSPADTWRAVSKALRYGRRGLRGGSSLHQLLRKHSLK